MPAPDCQPGAVKIAQDIAVLLGADPYFLDPAEYDGLSTAAHLAPALTAAALMGSVTNSPSWREMRRMTPRDLLHFSRPLKVGGPALARAAILNKKSALHWLDTTIEGLRAIRAQVEQENQNLLAAQLGAISDTREEWLADWKRNLWEKRDPSETATSGGWFGQILGFGQPRETGRNQQRPHRDR